jgi:hypothetical protein
MLESSDEGLGEPGNGDVDGWAEQKPDGHSDD